MKPLILANWKSHKTLIEAVNYVQAVGEQLHQLNEVEVVLCPPMSALAIVEGLIRDTRVELGAQMVSAWKEGAYTGEVAATMLQGLCQYVIVGHSERRKFRQESVELVNEQIKRCMEVKLQPVVCVSNEEEVKALVAVKDKAPQWIVAFEPLEAIGSGKPEDPEMVKRFMEMVKRYLGKSTRVIYGGSVDANNVRQYVGLTEGALVGGASLDPQGFLELCSKAGKAG